MLAIRDLVRDVAGQLQPACPSCGKALQLTRAMPRPGSTDLETYGCRQCGFWLTEAADHSIAHRGQ
jgi:predicted RNA-binding Zn-ribbon protein involved in translation (DUF1610 family)